MNNSNTITPPEEPKWCDFDIEVGRLTRLHPALIAVHLAKLYAPQFEAVGTKLQRCDFLLLVLLADYSVFSLTDPEFDPADELCALMETQDAKDRAIENDISGALDLDKEFVELTAKISALERDEARALWAALVFGQSATLAAYDRLVAAWWNPRFIIQWGHAQWR